MEIKTILESMLFALSGKLLPALKNEGPYQHRYDLPGSQ